MSFKIGDKVRTKPIKELRRMDWVTIPPSVAYDMVDIAISRTEFILSHKGWPGSGDKDKIFWSNSTNRWWHANWLEHVSPIKRVYPIKRITNVR